MSQPHHPQGFPALIGVLGGTVLVVLGMIRSAVTLRRWYARPEQRPQGPPGVAWHIVLPLVIHLGWALLLLAGLPLVANRSLPFMLHYMPDLGWTLVLSAGLALGCGILRTVLALAVLRLRHSSASASAPIHA